MPMHINPISRLAKVEFGELPVRSWALRAGRNSLLVRAGPLGVSVVSTLFAITPIYTPYIIPIYLELPIEDAKLRLQSGSYSMVGQGSGQVQ